MRSRAPQLLDEDDTASMATMIMMSHHAFRRDAAQLADAVARMCGGDRVKAATLAEEWKSFREALHGHHEHEDADIFPDLVARHPSLAAEIARLSGEHQLIDPLLERGDRAFAELKLADAVPVLSQLSALLHPHLAAEEEHLIPCLRDQREFPAPKDDAEANMYAEGFAWAMHGIHPHVLERVHVMLPAAVTSRVKATSAAFDERHARIWGELGDGASLTSVPDWLPGGR